jgi:hypothetical protein
MYEKWRLNRFATRSFFGAAVPLQVRFAEYRELGMSRTKARIASVIVAGAVVSLSASSCVDNNGSVVVIGILAPPITASAGGGACVYTPNIIGPFLSYGTLDVAFSQQYVPVLLLGNQLVAQANASLDRLETDDVIVQGATVRVTDASGATLDNYTVPGDGFIPASTGGTPGLTSFATTIVSPKVSQQFAPTGASALAYGVTKRLVSYVKIFGITTGGTHIESGEVGIPVDLCNGCLVTFPAGANDPALTQQPNCLATGQSGGTTVSPPCITGQDQFIDCRLCTGNAACDPSLRP